MVKVMYSSPLVNFSLILIIKTKRHPTPFVCDSCGWSQALPRAKSCNTHTHLCPECVSIWDPSLQTTVTELPPGRKSRGRGETECVKESLTGVRRKLSKASWPGFEKSKRKSERKKSRKRKVQKEE